MKGFLVFACFIASITCLAQTSSYALTAVYEDKRQVVKLKWMHQASKVKSYQLQRSADKMIWTDVAVVGISSQKQQQFFTYVDEKPIVGKNFYRLKVMLQHAAFSYSNAIMVIIGKPGNSWIMYPVPVRDLLNLQYNGTALINGVIAVTIQNTITKQVFHKLRMASTTRNIQIPVSNLGHGLYLVSIAIGNKLVWNQQFSK